jgi:RNA ligase (TIGR02306 family)
MTTERKLATIQQVEALTPIEGADKIELLTMVGLGWQCVVQKGIHAVGNYVVYCEIDSFVDVSRPYFDWLEKNAIIWEGKRGARIKSMRLRGQISQGIILPLHEVFGPEPCTPAEYAFLRPVSEEDLRQNRYSFRQDELVVGLDLTETLGVLKWEKPIPANLSGKVRGNFPSHTPKTDEERIQNFWSKIVQRAEMYPHELFEVTEKLEGSSMTGYFTLEDLFGICSRTLDLEETEDNLFWRMARKLSLPDTLPKLCLDTRQGVYPSPPVPAAMSLQGELIGPGVQGNYYGLTEHQFRIFNVYDIARQRYLAAEDRRYVVGCLDGAMHVPWQTPMKLSELVAMGRDAAIAFADGPSQINPDVPREGVVFKSVEMSGFSFKIISNEYLIKTGN